MTVKQMGKQRIALALAALFAACFLLSSCAPQKSSAGTLSAAFLYRSGGETEHARDVRSQLEQSFLANLELACFDTADKTPALDAYDLLYLDDSLELTDEWKASLVSYVERGGSVFLPNALLPSFDPSFFGAEKIAPVGSLPSPLTFPEPADEDLTGIQEIIRDFLAVYEQYQDYEELARRDYGWGVVPAGAVSLADANGLSVYGVNRLGEGCVFYTNPLLPNFFQINGFHLQRTDSAQTHFAHSTATANQLLLSEFASYVSKRKYGYSVKRVLGSFGSPDMSWQLHYEELTGIANNSAVLFSEICKEFRTVPSFTLIRNSYKWFAKSETLTFLFGQDGRYPMDFTENAYSSGTHAVEDDRFLVLSELAGGSYFEDDHSFTQCAYPCVGDWNGDGLADVICGSSDGCFYFFAGVSTDGEWKLARRVVLSDRTGETLRVPADSSPAVLDYDGDGIADILSGSQAGDIYLFRGAADGTLEPAQRLDALSGSARSLPCAGDIDGDGAADLVLGSDEGVVRIFLNENGTFRLRGSVSCPGETFLAPCPADFDGDARPELLLGTFDGYVKILKNTGGLHFEDAGYLDTEEMNYKGNSHIKFGNNCVPRLYDLDRDGCPELIAGALEYGPAIPIDSPYFPLRDQLQAQVDYIQSNRFYLGLHFYSNQYASAEREAEELALHKRALDTYAVNYGAVGANMHTWFTSDLSDDQTVQSAKNAGLLWLSGFRPPYSKADPQTAGESILACPFFLDFANREMLLTNASVLAYGLGDYAYLSAKYDLPVSEYYHCDFTYQNEDAARDMVRRVADYQRTYGYNFVREDQMMKSAAAAYNAKLTVARKDDGTLTLSSAVAKKGFRLYDEKYQRCTGVKLCFAAGADLSGLSVDADVWRCDPEKNELYLALNRKVTLRFGASGSPRGSYPLAGSDAAHILSVNIPASIQVSENRASVLFEDDGMMQVRVLGTVGGLSEGWDTEYADGVTTLTRFGSERDLYFTFE